MSGTLRFPVTRRTYSVVALATILCLPSMGLAGEAIGHLSVPVWTSLPFVLLLGAIAIMPIVHGHWWHLNRNKFMVSVACALPVIGNLLSINGESQGESGRQLVEHLRDFTAFVLMLLSLYVISGGILLIGDIPGRPSTNFMFLAGGALLANIIGTTGASMVLIRPLLRINHSRRRKLHVPIFFILIVSNTGGLLTPLGDPPLFLGFLNGVDFFWTTRLWREWLLVNGLLLAIFLVWDIRAYRGEPVSPSLVTRRPMRLLGAGLNAPLLGGVIATVLLQGPAIGRGIGATLGVGDLTLSDPWSQVIQGALILLSWQFTRKSIRHGNQFSWGPIVEVAVLFLGIFVTMIPALALLRMHGGRLNLTAPIQFFWLTGLLSAILDNAPTYLTFATLAAGENDLGWLSAEKPGILAAISCGAVFMGAITYIGNGPNFMVKAIADAHGYKMPSVATYTLYSLSILLPVFALATVMFFL